MEKNRIVSLRIFVRWFLFFSLFFSVVDSAVAVEKPSESLTDAQVDSYYKKLTSLRANHSPLLKGASGLLIRDIFPNSQAEKLGLRPGDIIVSYNQKATNAGTPWKGASKNKKFVPIEVIRRGKLLSFNAHGGHVGFSFLMEPTSLPILRIETGMHTGPISDIDVNLKGHFFVSSSRDKTLRVWSLPGGKLLNTFRVPIDNNFGKLNTVAISPDGKLIATGGWTGGWRGTKWDRWQEEHSIYVFNRVTGRIVHHIAWVKGRISHLSFSPDGQYLAATLVKSQGMRVWETDKWSLVNKDIGYNGTQCDFSHSGSLVTVSFKGEVRLYDHYFHLKVKRNISLSEITSVAFSPDGKKIAVGTAEQTANVHNKIYILRTSDLNVLYLPDIKGIYNSTMLAKIAWSADANYLYAGSNFYGKKILLRRWDDGGKGRYSDWFVGNDTVMDLQALPDGSILVANADPSITKLSPKGREKWQILADTVSKLDNPLRVSNDGKTIKLGLERGGKSLVTFSMEKQQLTTSPTHSNKLKLPTTYTLNASEWMNVLDTIVRDHETKVEGLRSIAIAPDKKSVLLGMELTLRRFDKETGAETWKQGTTGAVFGVNISGDGKTAVVQLDDGTIRWYRYSDGKLLLSLFIKKSKKSWVLWTPEGFFDHSPGGEGLIGFHLNQGADKAAKFIALDQLYDQFYRPDLVAKKIQGGHDQEIAEIAQRINVGRIFKGGQPPFLKLVSPKSSAHLKQQKAEFKVCATDQGGGMGKVIYRVNGVALSGDAESGRGAVKMSEDLSGCTSVLKRSFMLQPGENTISVTAFNSSNEIESKPATIKVNMTGTVREKPTLYILAVGINAYRDSSLRLTYAADDATAILAELQQQGKRLFKKVVVRPVLNKEATIAGIGTAFSKLSGQIKANDVFIFYAASHGQTVDGIYYMIPQEMVFKNMASIKKHAISKEQLTRWLASIVAGKSLVLLDTCNSGDFINSRGLAEKGAVDKLMRATGRHTIVASLGTQEALEGYKGHGVFTYALLQGLSGQADSNGDNQISVNELADYVSDKVPEITRKMGAEQFPMQSLQGQSFPVGLVQ